MLIRLVRLTIRPDALEEFLAHFDASAPRIRAFEGCEHLELWQDARFLNVVTTYSHWTDAEALECYRRSGFFRETWAQVKPLFAARPVARSHYVIRPADSQEKPPPSESPHSVSFTPTSSSRPGPGRPG